MERDSQHVKYNVIHETDQAPISYDTIQHTDIVLSTMTISVDFTPSKTPYNPRHMLGGTTQPDGTYVSGFFDKGTFKEYLGANVLHTVQHPLSHSLFTLFFLPLSYPPFFISSFLCPPFLSFISSFLCPPFLFFIPSFFRFPYISFK